MSKFCPNNHSAFDGEFCYICGTKLLPAPICPKCNRQFYNFENFCKTCGNKLPEIDVDKIVNEQKLAEEQTKQLAQKKKEKQGRFIEFFRRLFAINK